jgi:hypothetical protein
VRTIIGCAHPLENPCPVSRFQAYIACFCESETKEVRPTLFEDDLRNGCRNVRETLVF